ncbi:DUF2914 domain-containing protein [Candidatus Nitronereus thalassa]|uniref:DUF2914 domain-containing protein n=1 Tax=Candidatus Nitronereus thalassa TaxID=3020898 RepID=A0ABU3KCI6_9BACT|nr:DUF2914 domain-containing protein [Candidatus Nitronereus thalassa]MDT7044230.1 DUF2914 domain-containing protein [Candidatus Nitronereus thalassa]
MSLNVPALKTFRTFLDKPYTPILSFCAGVTYDTLTLTRIDRLFDNLILLLYVALLGTLIILTGRAKLEDWPSAPLHRSPWSPLSLLHKTKTYHIPALHFLFGSLFSAYAIVYSRSASLNSSAIFLGVIVIVLVANEFYHHRFSTLTLQVTLYALVTFSFFTFFLPVVTGYMNTLVFLLGVGLSIAVVFRVVMLTYRGVSVPNPWSPVLTGLPAIGLVAIFTGFYFLNWIPPVPLSLKFAGIYHQVEKIEDSYHLTFEEGPWYNFWKDTDDVIRGEGPAYCFISVFAPVRLETTNYHHWQYRPTSTIETEKARPFHTTDRIPITISGGREAGYRSYTVKNHVNPGDWQVTIETEDERIIDRIEFSVKASVAENPEYETITY